MHENPLTLLMNPKSIATVGAGNNPLKMGAIQALSIVKDGYEGAFYPIHPTEQKVFGYQAYRSAFDLPETPDLVMFVLPAPLVIPILEDFGKIGTKRAIVITAGFRETGPEGAVLEKELMAVAKRYGIRFLGPNCIGIINSAISLNVTILPLNAGPGKLGMASQSGTYITQTLPYLESRGMSFSKAISVGNESDLNINDALEYLGQDDQTKAIALYIEGLKDGRRFLEVARQITPHKPVLAQYVGGSTAGAKAGSSHTGAMAGPDYIYDGLFAQAGIIRVDSIEELYNQSWVLATQPPLRGKKIAVITNSGGPGTAISHTCNQGGLEVPTFSEPLQEKIRALIPAYGASINPVDLTFHLDSEVLSQSLPALILESEEVDGLIIHGLMSTGFMRAIYPHAKELLGFNCEEDFIHQFKSDLTDSVNLPADYGKPVVLSSFFGREDDHTKTYQDHHFPVLDIPEKAARGMIALYRYNQIRQRKVIAPPPLPPLSEKAATLIQEACDQGHLMLDEYRSKQLLAAYGIPVSPEKLVFTAAEAVAAAAELGYPVVVKGCSPQFAHKTDHGLVQLDLKDAAAVEKGCTAIREAAGEEIPLLVAKMIKGNRELMAGMVRQAGFGPCLLFGLGGIFTEALQDRNFRVAPLSAADGEELIDQLRAAAMLGAFRGLPPVNRAALVSLLQRLGEIALLHPAIAELDLNPILVSGGEPVVVDALVVLADRDREDRSH